MSIEQPIFIVGTGRCGCSMLTQLLHQHPDVLSLSEVFTLLSDLGGKLDAIFTEDEITGEDFWQILADIAPRESLMLKHNVAMPEVIYLLNKQGAAYNANSGIPAILQVTLPQLGCEHDAIFLELKDYICSKPKAGMREHYDSLFNWLKDKLNRKVWVERSGASFVYINELYRLYPDAKYVHIVRDGRNVALSMSKHLGFRMFMLATLMAEIMGIDPFIHSDRTNAHLLPDYLKPFLPENFDRDAFLNFQMPIEELGQLWSNEMAAGCMVLDHIDDANKLTLHYEDFCFDAKSQIKALTDFIGVEASDDWIAQTANLVTPSLSSWLDLPLDERDRLEKACEAGMDLMDKCDE